MNRAFLPCLKSLFVVLLAVSSIAGAEEKKVAKPDLAKGEAIYANGDAARAFIQVMRTPEGSRAIRESGMEPLNEAH